ncbi:MAG: S-methyl-5-thioribose-1-phosphate isomerase [Verrucomicrobiia bacterium]|jgi:S-methyl-5-thioribose-1-phosphate isomerase
MKVRGKNYRAVWMDGAPSAMECRDVVVVNQPLLPHRFELLRLRNHRETANAIKTMIVRGAGTIGATAGYGLAQACLEVHAEGLRSKREARIEAAGQSRWKKFHGYVRKAYSTLLKTRPTAADLKHALDRVAARVEDADDVEMACASAIAEAENIADEYVERGRKIAEVGLPLIRSGSRVLTHCNAGWLALVDWGSAPAPIYLAHRKGRKVFVWVDETRPRNQGANLTSWEFLQEGVPHKIIADNAGGFLMRRGEVDLCIVGADRIAANGDVANKIGTYEKAVLAHENGVPFYVAAPTSTIDLTCESGDDIPIEERDEAELHYVWGKNARNKLERVRVSPEKAVAANPAFDVTPARYITGIITEKGIVKPGQVKKLFAK